MSKETNSLAHTTWNCKHHHRRQVIYGKIKYLEPYVTGKAPNEATACKRLYPYVSEHTAKDKRMHLWDI